VFKVGDIVKYKPSLINDLIPQGIYIMKIVGGDNPSSHNVKLKCFNKNDLPIFMKCNQYKETGYYSTTRKYQQN
jgi:hypothetical protein